MPNSPLGRRRNARSSPPPYRGSTRGCFQVRKCLIPFLKWGKHCKLRPRLFRNIFLNTRPAVAAAATTTTTTTTTTTAAEAAARPPRPPAGGRHRQTVERKTGISICDIYFLRKYELLNYLKDSIPLVLRGECENWPHLAMNESYVVSVEANRADARFSTK